VSSTTIKPRLKNIDLYITNVCNFNCSNCNRLNNFYFSGHQYWKDYSEIYTKWSEILDITHIGILGGEPMLNPSLLEWVKGIRELWPDSVIEITTNGTRLKHWDNLYTYLKDYKIGLQITLHNDARRAEVMHDLNNLLVKPVKEKIHKNFNEWVLSYNSVKDASWPVCTNFDDYNNLPVHIKNECKDIHQIDPESFFKNCNITFTDVNGVTATVEASTQFVTAPLKYNNTGAFTVYDSDPNLAHDVCISKTCHHLLRGKLYKCHHVALLPEFIEQFHVDISDSDRQLLNAYAPLEVDATRDEVGKFLKNLQFTLPQCKLCPSKLEYFNLNSTNKKTKVPKRIIQIKSK